MEENKLADLVVRKYPDLEAQVSNLVAWQKGVTWELRPQFKNEKNIPQIMDFVDTAFTLLLNDNMSLARFGDGELGLMANTRAVNYQPRDRTLAASLTNAMLNKKTNCKIALTKMHIYKAEPLVYKKEAESFIHKEYIRLSKAGKYFRFFDPEYKYADAHISGVNVLYSNTSNPYLVQDYYSLISKLINRDIILVTGQKTFKECKHKLPYDFATSVTEVCVPAKNSYAYHDAIKQTLLNINGSGSRLVLLACGPEAKLLAYDLCDKMRCLDIGHMLADYNDFKRGSRTPNFWFQ